MQVSNNVQEAYDNQYDEKVHKWRKLGAKYKFQNILQVTEGRTFQKVLDYGAGEGSIMEMIAGEDRFQELYGVEISDSGIGQIKQKNLAKLKEIRKFDGYNTGFADKEFDLAYCSHVIEHVEFPRLLLREISRISKFQVFEVPLDYHIGIDKNINHFLSYGHINVYTPSLLKFLLKTEGFEVLNELHTEIADEVTLFNWYENMGLEKSFKREFTWKINKLKRKVWRAIANKAKVEEYGYNAYTCLIQNTEGLQIFK